MSDSLFRCWLAQRDGDHVVGRVTELPVERLPPGEVLIRVSWSSLNYKDALAATGHPGVAPSLPHVPGIDAAGVVERSEVSAFSPGDEVLVTGYDLGQRSWGGWSERIRVPADWIVRRPAPLSLRQSMILGTAGFTAAQCVAALVRAETTPESGDIVVTGASGGVGSFAVRILAQLGYRVVASTGKPEHADLLRAWGAAEIIDRAAVCDGSDRPMLKARWAGGVDTVGGRTLATLLRSTKYGGCIAACGLVAGPELPVTVYPFLLRGVTLAGVASADCPMDRRIELWKRLAGEWNPFGARRDVIAPGSPRESDAEAGVTEVGLDGLEAEVDRILRGEVVGRVLVRP